MRPAPIGQAAAFGLTFACAVWLTHTAVTRPGVANGPAVLLLLALWAGLAWAIVEQFRTQRKDRP